MRALTTKQNLPFWLLTSALFVAFMVTALAMQGLGGDGVVYAAISWNMAHGIGSLWHPYYLAPFYEHPPLAFYLESLFFKLLGDHFWIEKLYSGLAALISILAMLKIWKLSVRISWHYAWLPLLFWMTVGDNLDAYKNNLLENTLICFATWAAFILLKTLINNRLRFISLISAALLLTAALITKGPQCLFVMSTILLYWLIFRRISFWRALSDTVILIGGIVLFMALILCYKPAYHDLHQYWLQQFWATVSGARAGGYVGWKRLYVLWLLFQYLIPLIILVPLLIYIQARRLQVAYKALLLAALKNQWFLFYLILGLLASLPVMLSSRLQEPYILQSFPFFILATAQIITPIIAEWLPHLKFNSSLYRRLLLISLLLLTIALVNVILSYGKIGRHKALLGDILVIGQVTPRNSTVSVNTSVIESADVVQAYFYRYWQIKLTTTESCHYYVVNKTDLAPVDYSLVPVVLQQLVLYQNPNKHCDTFNLSL
ncbi:MAG: hypothetical protein EXR81_05955 [Gammaproteobacteria bacterium]|nr:hypothetical protein [Gammaproteobacteria bacterium]